MFRNLLNLVTQGGKFVDALLTCGNLMLGSLKIVGKFEGKLIQLLDIVRIVMVEVKLLSPADSLSLARKSHQNGWHGTALRDICNFVNKLHAPGGRNPCRQSVTARRSFFKSTAAAK